MFLQIIWVSEGKIRWNDFVKLNVRKKSMTIIRIKGFALILPQAEIFELKMEDKNLHESFFCRTKQLGTSYKGNVVE